MLDKGQKAAEKQRVEAHPQLDLSGDTMSEGNSLSPLEHQKAKQEAAANQQLIGLAVIPNLEVLGLTDNRASFCQM